jgi:protein-arginine kinase activator protein McsA
MAICRECKNEVEELKVVQQGTKKVKLCEDCADRAAESGAIAEESEAVVQQMMGFKGRR